ncbi:hypothetical protein BS17DRAFT_818181 [Gyrodon lividus]|nr:hypothetical protein BS17DRAFT_818181 [Gyrodon lividus]
MQDITSVLPRLLLYVGNIHASYAIRKNSRPSQHGVEYNNSGQACPVTQSGPQIAYPACPIPCKNCQQYGSWYIKHSKCPTPDLPPHCTTSQHAPGPP